MCTRLNYRARIVKTSNVVNRYVWAAIAFVLPFIAVAAHEWSVSLDPAVERGRIKPMHAVNNGPSKARSNQTRSNFDEYKALRIPYARLHDSAHCTAYGGHHVVDVTGVFPNFDADENDPASYDFTMTDEYLDTIRRAGTEPYYRRGQSIEHGIKKYGVNPPKDFAKWARICEHIVRHYNEGWANGHRWNIKYWEIWNEPDGNKATTDGRQGPTWTGTMEQFLELYKVASLHLRKCFGRSIMIGGPGFCGWDSWKDHFLPFCAKENLPLDFYSYHGYFIEPRNLGGVARDARKLLDDNGFTETETHLNEYNYTPDWADGWVYTLECESGRFNQKGAASIAAVMCVCQDAPVDMLMYYDARLGSGMNGMFNSLTLQPICGYYAFLAWSRLAELGMEIDVKVATPDIADKPQLYAVGARNADGRLALFLVRYSHDNNVFDTRRIRVALPNGCNLARTRCMITDANRMFTDTPLIDNGDNTATVKMQPNSFVLIEF